MTQPRATLDLLSCEGEQGNTMLKRLLTNVWAQEIAVFLAVVYVALVRRTIRWEVRGSNYIEKVWDEDLPMLGCVWHGRLLMTLQGWYKNRDKMVVLSSRSREGNMGARFARWFKVGVFRGSTSNRLKPGKKKGGSAAFRAMIAHLKNKGCAIVTPDGPRGPRMRASYGIILMARDSGVPIVPYTWSTRRKTVLHDSWDKQCLPHFFTRGVIIWGEPIHIPKEARNEDLEDLRLLLETRMNELTLEADQAVSGEVIEPAPAVDMGRGAQGAAG
jgi:lysophospholipid acyltransferase (LPLAT)-like uncharacterized protein